jgi:hypothetical protein
MILDIAMESRSICRIVDLIDDLIEVYDRYYELFCHSKSY